MENNSESQRRYEILDTDRGPELFISDQRITAGDIFAVPGWENLVAISCRGVEFDDPSLPWLPSLKKLQSALFDRSNINDDSMRSVSQLKLLADLTIARSAISEHGIRLLKQVERAKAIKLRKLKALSLPRNEGITDTALIIIGAFFENLNKLDLSHTRVTDDGLIALKLFKLIDVLDLRDTQVSIAQLSHVSPLPALRLVFLSPYAIRGNQEKLEQFKKDNPKLQLVFQEKTSSSE